MLHYGQKNYSKNLVSSAIWELMKTIFKNVLQIYMVSQINVACQTNSFLENTDAFIFTYKSIRRPK